MLGRVAAELQKIGDEIWVTDRPLLVFGLLLTDAAFHPTPASPRGVRFWTKLTTVRDGFGPNALVRWFIRDRRAMRASIERVLAWDFDRVTVTHGEVLESGGRAALAKAYAWL